MAKAIVVPPVTETKVVEVEPGKVTLELSFDEADILRSILGQFVSNGPTSPIYEALYTSQLTDNVGRTYMRDSYGRFDRDSTLKFVFRDGA